MADIPLWRRCVARIFDVQLPAPGRPHRYLSTGCLHGEHGYCQSNAGSNGQKVPAQCKFCGAPCVCPCHREAGS